MIMCIGIIRHGVKTVTYIQDGRVILKTTFSQPLRPPKETAVKRQSDAYVQ